MPRLDERLKCVARMIRSPRHADIGSDHAYLLRALLATGRIQHAIAIENKRQPHRHSLQTLEGCSADVRLADGLAGLRAGEVDSLSICGMGGKLMRKILDAAPERLPPQMFLQPNDDPETVRRWASNAGYHLIDEQTARGHWVYVVLQLERRPGIDPAYVGTDLEAAVRFGPHLICRWDRTLEQRLREEQAYWRSFERLTTDALERLACIDRLLAQRSGGRP